MQFNHRNFYFIITLFFLLPLAQSCSVSKPVAGQDPYIMDDSTTIYSTNASKPFKYGYALTKQECKDEFEDYVRDYQLKKGDEVADIGAASGWVEGAFSVLVDSVHFYLEDIDTNFLSETQLNKVITYYNKVRESPQTNTFKFVIGTEKKTNLPDSTFDKVIFNNTFHEIYEVYDMIEDARTKMKPEGKLMIREAFSNDYKTIWHPDCNFKCYQVKKLIKIFEIQDLYITGMTEPENSFYNHLTFEKSKERSDEFLARKNKIEAYMQELDLINKFKSANDSVCTNKISADLKLHAAEIAAVYTTLENYVNTVGYQWLNNNKLQAAINVLKINIALYPDSANAFDSMGEAYMKNLQYALALQNYTKSLALDPDNDNAKDAVKKLKGLLHLPE
ncbi:MAG: Methyltransferase type 11 [Bacteroidetes bacterium]|nr:Methyltransferase type 11 [Bacteroidota bacterium]